MKSLKNLYTILFASVLLLSVACSKSEVTTVPLNKFTWTYKGSSYIASQYSAYLYSRGAYLIIGAQGNTLASFPQCNFSLNSFNKGSYPVNSSGINVFRYVDGSGDELEASTGEVNITAYGSDVISGNFSAMILSPSGTATPISGTFSNIPVVP